MYHPATISINQCSTAATTATVCHTSRCQQHGRVLLTPATKLHTTPSPTAKLSQPHASTAALSCYSSWQFTVKLQASAAELAATCTLSMTQLNAFIQPRVVKLVFWPCLIGPPPTASDVWRWPGPPISMGAPPACVAPWPALVWAMCSAYLGSDQSPAPSTGEHERRRCGVK